MATKDNYDFSQPSPISNPGFILFQNEDNQLYYFHCNDICGLPFLYSQSYLNAENSQKGLRSVLKNGGIPKRYKEEEEDGKFYFILKAGNHQEIARSRKYATKNKRKSAIEYLQRVAKSKYPMAKKEEKKNLTKTKATAKSASASEKMLSKDQNKLPKHAFRLEFYDIESTPYHYAGIIQHLNTKEKQPFQGIDLHKISQFLETHLPDYKNPISTSEKESISVRTSPTLPKTSIPKSAKDLIDKVQAKGAIQKEENSPIAKAPHIPSAKPLPAVSKRVIPRSINDLMAKTQDIASAKQQAIQVKNSPIAKAQQISSVKPLPAMSKRVIPRSINDLIAKTQDIASVKQQAVQVKNSPIAKAQQIYSANPLPAVSKRVIPRSISDLMVKTQDIASAKQQATRRKTSAVNKWSRTSSTRQNLLHKVSRKGFPISTVPVQRRKISLGLQLKSKKGYQNTLKIKDPISLEITIQKKVLEFIQKKGLNAKITIMNRNASPKISTTQSIQNGFLRGNRLIMDLNTQGLPSGDYQIVVYLSAIGKKGDQQILIGNCYFRLL